MPRRIPERTITAQLPKPLRLQKHHSQKVLLVDTVMLDTKAKPNANPTTQGATSGDTRPTRNDGNNENAKTRKREHSTLNQTSP